jgi:hypothetical protein
MSFFSWKENELSIRLQSDDKNPTPLPTLRNTRFDFLRALAKFQKATITYVMSVYPSAWNSLATTGRTFKKF